MPAFSNEEVERQVIEPCDSGETEANETEESEFHWIEIELVYENDGEPVVGEEYCIKMPDGVEVRGVLNYQGRAMVNVVKDEGDCEITFPRLDEEAWESG